MIGKSRKFAASGLVSDYRHTVETMAESEGFGSSGRVDTEMTLSEDSCSPKRKCISLNGDGYDNSTFGVPVQVLSFSKMSKLERKELEIRLKRELEEVRILQRRVASLNGNGNVNGNGNGNAVVNHMVLSPTSDIRSCSDGMKRPALENPPRRVAEHHLQGKKRLPMGKNGPRTKKGHVDHHPRKQGGAAGNPSNGLVMKQCEKLLNQLMSHQFGWVFNTPVDVVKLNIPDYYTVIKHPMDLGTVKSKLGRGEYSSPVGFASDVRLTFSNAMTYNPPGNDVHLMAQSLSKHFEQRWRVIEKKISMNTGPQGQQGPQLLPSRVDTQVRNETVRDQVQPFKKKKVAPVGYVGKLEPVKKVISHDDKLQLSSQLEALLNELPESIIDFLKENSSGGEVSEDEIEIDIDVLSDEVLFKLRKMMDDFLAERKHQAKAAEPCEMELHNESGFSNSSIQPGKGNDAIDEDVDIGGNDHHVSSFPPVEIEKDTANKNSRCSSPSSSSSDSGTSSDSDSGSSSSESEGKKAQQGNKLQGAAAEPNLDQNQSDVDQDVGRNKSWNSSSQVENNPPGKPPAVEVDGLKEGESAPSERSVSPDKLYRAALLRSRFADTILKAQEKTLEKGEKRDPEKLRLEREELERRQREEKARLQAEAKAAEVARKKAEAEAAAEAKRKRELEREAARLALQKMEKTVEINENCQFMEDLEMLRSAPADNLSSFIETTSPTDSPNLHLGSFRLRANNPLEQLGLFRKDDDEEEDEVEGAPHNAPLNPPAANDVEEGEID